MTKTKRCPKGHRRNPITKGCDKKAASMKRRSLPPTPSSNVYRDTSKLVPADYDYANDPVLWSAASPASAKKSQTRKRCPKGHRRNPITKGCDKKLKSKKISLSLQSEMSMPELEDITRSPSVHVKSMSMFSQGNSPMTQNTMLQTKEHYSETPVSIKNKMVSSLPPAFVPKSPDYPPPDFKPLSPKSPDYPPPDFKPFSPKSPDYPPPDFKPLSPKSPDYPPPDYKPPSPAFVPTSPDYPPPDYKPLSPKSPDYPPPIFTKGARYYKTQMQKKHLCKVDAKTGKTKYPVGKNNACIAFGDIYYNEFFMTNFLKHVYDEIPNNVTKEQLVEIFTKYISLLLKNYYDGFTRINFLDIKIIDDWMFTDYKLENKFSTVGKNKPFKNKKEKENFYHSVRKNVQHLVKHFDDESDDSSNV